jgi:hypothetical protein
VIGDQHFLQPHFVVCCTMHSMLKFFSLLPCTSQRPGCISHVGVIYAEVFRFTFVWAVPWLRRLVAGLSSPRLVFDSRSVHVRFVVGQAAGIQIFLRPRPSSPVSIVPTNGPYSSSNTHFSYQIKKWTKSGNFPKSNAFWKNSPFLFSAPSS